MKAKLVATASGRSSRASRQENVATISAAAAQPRMSECIDVLTQRGTSHPC